jgi:hypothetical protein
MLTSLTGNSNTFNIFLLKVKAQDLSTEWVSSWGLDGTNQNDMAYSMTVNPDGGKILVVGSTDSYLHPAQNPISNT